MKTGGDTAATTAASDEMRKKATMMIQVEAAPAASHTLSASSTPSAVETPLPPWKRWKTGYIWPITTAIATAAILYDAGTSVEKIRSVRNTASHPFAASPSNV